MEIESLAMALEREHREIDDGIEAFTADPSGDRGRHSLTRAVRALRRHIYLEEEFLFPALYQTEHKTQVLVMLREHAQIWRTLAALENEPDTGAAFTLCRRLTVQLLHHNLKEEKALYPEMDRIVPEPAAERLRSFLRSGELPEGWVCIRART